MAKRPTSPTRQVAIRWSGNADKFEQLHEEGAQEFGATWLHMTDAVAQHASSFTNITDPATKEMLTTLTRCCLQRLKKERTLQLEKPCQA